jgi:hypothetical protein
MVLFQFGSEPWFDKNSVELLETEL